MLTIPIDSYLPGSIISDLVAAKKLIPSHGSIRLYRIPVFEFNKAVDQVMRQRRCAFRPTVLGLPINMTEKPVPEVVVVYDDDTNVAQNTRREEEVC